MVGLWFLVPAIGVRVPDRQLHIKRLAFASLFMCRSARTATRRAEENSPGDCFTRRGREYLLELERSEQF